MAQARQFPNRPPLPKPQQPTQLVSLTPSPRTHTLIAILLGIQGPKEIVKKDNSKTLLATLYLADDTLPSGVELVVWGRQALQTVHLQIMDVVQIKKAFVESDKFRGMVVKFRGDATVTRVSGEYETIVKRLLSWRGVMYNQLLGFAERGRLRSREWSMQNTPIEKRLIKQSNDSTLAALVENGGVKEVDFVHVTSIRIRVQRDKGNEIEAIRSLCRRTCTRCTKRLRDDACQCGCRDWKWGFGWLVIGLRDESGEFMATAEGDVVGRLLFGVSVESVVHDDHVARVCCRVLEGLVKDGGCFRVVVRARGGARLGLLHLFV